jgi:hypothetical protein
VAIHVGAAEELEQSREERPEPRVGRAHRGDARAASP